jgi:hypothetical protein
MGHKDRRRSVSTETLGHQSFDSIYKLAYPIFTMRNNPTKKFQEATEPCQFAKLE